ncbi:Alkanesulfonate ABC transporter substrate-binding protein SsuA [Azospirillum melinis]
MKRLIGMLVGAAALVGLATPFAAAAEKQVRIGYQKYGTLIILKEQGLLEKRLESLGYDVVWTEFPGGPQLLEALNVGALDFGTTGEAPPIFAQAAGAPLLYVGYEPASPKGEAILVPKSSTIRSVAQLKGRKVALNKGSNVHYLLVKALEKAGLSVADIEPVYLPPADARAAFERGAVDAWAIWDPFYAAASVATGARTLTDGTGTDGTGTDGAGTDGAGLVKNHQFFLAAKPFPPPTSRRSTPSLPA